MSLSTSKIIISRDMSVGNVLMKDNSLNIPIRIMEEECIYVAYSPYIEKKFGEDKSIEKIMEGFRDLNEMDVILRNYGWIRRGAYWLLPTSLSL